MASEASRKKARETCDHDHNTVGCWTCGTLQPCKPCEAISAALDAARAEGVAEGEQRERWECYAAATLAFAQFRGVAPAVVERRVSEAIAARGAMRGPEEEK